MGKSDQKWQQNFIKIRILTTEMFTSAPSINNESSKVY